MRIQGTGLSTNVITRNYGNQPIGKLQADGTVNVKKKMLVEPKKKRFFIKYLQQYDNGGIAKSQVTIIL